MPNGSVSLANIRLSLVNGTAFVDFSAVGTLTPYVGQRLTLTDSAGKKAVGYLKSVGTGETLDSELIGWTNNPSFAYETFTVNGDTINLDAVINSAGYGIAYNTLGTAQGKLFKVTYNMTLNSGTAPEFVAGSNTSYSNKLVVLSSGTAGSRTGYFVGRYATEYAGFNTGNGTETNFATASTSLKQVLTPSATGVTITSTRGGSVYSWESIESGFNYNDSAGYTYFISLPRTKKSKFISQYNYFYRRNR